MPLIPELVLVGLAIVVNGKTFTLCAPIPKQQTRKCEIGLCLLYNLDVKIIHSTKNKMTERKMGRSHVRGGNPTSHFCAFENWSE